MPSRPISIAYSHRRALARGGGARVRGGASRRRCKTEHVEAELVAARTALVPGEPLTVALRLAMRQGLAHVLAQSGRFRLADDARVEAARRASPPARSSGRRRTRCPPGRSSTTATKARCCISSSSRPIATRDAGRQRRRSARAPTGWSARRPASRRAPISTLALPVADERGPDRAWGAAIAATRAALPQPLAGWKASARGQRARRSR